MRKPVKESRQLGGDLDKGGGSGDGARQVDGSHGLNSEARVTILKYKSDHVSETSHQIHRLSTVQLVSPMDSVTIYSKPPDGDTDRKAYSSGNENRKLCGLGFCVAAGKG